MSNYIFLTENYKQGPVIYFAIIEDKIETLNVSDTYAEYGQTIDASDAGDGLELLTQDAIFRMNKEHELRIGDVVYAYNNQERYTDILDALEASEKLIEGVDYVLFRETLKGFNYHDGSNWKTVTVAADNGESSHSILENEELVKILNEAIENREYEREGFGKKIYFGGDYVVIDNYCHGAWASFEVMSKEDFELSTIY